MFSSDISFRLYFPLSTSFWHRTKEMKQWASSAQTKLFHNNSGRINNRSSRFHLQIMTFRKASYGRGSFTVNHLLELHFSSQLLLSMQAFLKKKQFKREALVNPSKDADAILHKGAVSQQNLIDKLTCSMQRKKGKQMPLLIAGFRKCIAESSPNSVLSSKFNQ